MKKLFKVILHRKAVKELNDLNLGIKDRVVEALKEMRTRRFSRATRLDHMKP